MQTGLHLGPNTRILVVKLTVKIIKQTYVTFSPNTPKKKGNKMGLSITLHVCTNKF